MGPVPINQDYRRSTVGEFFNEITHFKSGEGHFQMKTVRYVGEGGAHT